MLQDRVLPGIHKSFDAKPAGLARITTWSLRIRYRSSWRFFSLTSSVMPTELKSVYPRCPSEVPAMVTLQRVGLPMGRGRFASGMTPSKKQKLTGRTVGRTPHQKIIMRLPSAYFPDISENRESNDPCFSIPRSFGFDRRWPSFLRSR